MITIYLGRNRLKGSSTLARLDVWPKTYFH